LPFTNFPLGLLRIWVFDCLSLEGGLKFHDVISAERYSTTKQEDSEAHLSVCVCPCRTDQQATLLSVYPVHLIWKLLVGFDWGSGGQGSKQ